MIFDLSFINELALFALSEEGSKRAHFAARQICLHGEVSTREIGEAGYKHPPRAAGDLKDEGFEVITTMRNDGSARFAVYTVPHPYRVRPSSTRANPPKRLRKELLARDGAYCSIHAAPEDEQRLQVEHRVPLAVSGAANVDWNADDFMLACASGNMAKKQACSACPNMKARDPAVCTRCFWASPTDYDHVATQLERVIVLTWHDDSTYNALKERSDATGDTVESTARSMLDAAVREDT